MNLFIIEVASRPKSFLITNLAAFFPFQYTTTKDLTKNLASLVSAKVSIVFMK